MLRCMLTNMLEKYHIFLINICKSWGQLEKKKIEISIN